MNTKQDKMLQRLELGVGVLKILTKYIEKNKGNSDRNTVANIEVIKAQMPALQEQVLKLAKALGMLDEATVKESIQASKQKKGVLARLADRIRF